jgi:hypothetical protein
MSVFAYRSCRLTALGLLVVAGGCQFCLQDELRDLKPVAEVLPNPVDFGERLVGADHRMSAKLLNTGTAGLEVKSVSVQPAGAPFAVVEAPDKPLKTVAEGASIPFEVLFHPPVRGVHNALLVLETTELENPRLEVPLTGVGGPPRIVVSPATLNFDLVNQGVGLTRTAQVENVGLDTLRVTEVTIAPTSDPGFRLAATDNFGSGDIPVGQSVNIVVEMQPVTSGAVSGVMHILSDAEGSPDTAVPLRADTNLGPVVRLVEKSSGLSDVRTDLYLDVVLDSTGTADPEGDPFALTWRVLQRPLGSQSILEETGTPAERKLYVDTVGVFLVEATGTDTRGAVGKAQARLRAIRDLALRLTWTPAPDAPCLEASTPEYSCGKTDVDLHLVAPGGQLGDYFTGCSDQPGCSARCAPQASGVVCKGRGTDCSYANRNPDWGVTSDPSDDPRQDIDDVMGWGPENISLNGPVAGDYTVQVHFCNDRLTNEGAVAQVEVLFHGELANPPVLGPVRLPHQDSLWVAGIIHYDPNATPKFTLTPLGETVIEGPPDLCNQ